MTENISTLHAHVSTASSDCDGPLYRDYVVGISDEERAAHIAADGVNDFTDIVFRERVTMSVISVYAIGEGGGQLAVRPEGVEWTEATDEGYRSASVRWCDDESCDPHAESQRDVFAEQMGY